MIADRFRNQIAGVAAAIAPEIDVDDLCALTFQKRDDVFVDQRAFPSTTRRRDKDARRPLWQQRTFCNVFRQGNAVKDGRAAHDGFQDVYEQSKL